MTAKRRHLVLLFAMITVFWACSTQNVAVYMVTDVSHIGAQVYVDENLVGTVPDNMVFKFLVPHGKHRIEIKKEGRVLKTLNKDYPPSQQEDYVDLKE